MALALLLPLLTWLQTLPQPGHPADLLPAPFLSILPSHFSLHGSSQDKLVTLRCLAPITSSVTMYRFYWRSQPQGPKKNFRNASSPTIEDRALPGAYSCVYLSYSSQGLTSSLESPPALFPPPWDHLPPGPGVQVPKDNGTAGDSCSSTPGCSSTGTRGGPGRSASCRWHPRMSPVFVAAALGFLLPRCCW